MDDFVPRDLSGEEKADQAAEDKKVEDPSEKAAADKTSVTEPAEEQMPEEQTQAAPEEYAAQTAAESNEAKEAASETAETIEEPAPKAEEAMEEPAPETAGGEAEALPDKLGKIFEVQQQLAERVECLGSLFQARIMHTEHEEKIVDQMHKELQKYKEDMYAQLVRPILLDVIEVRDSIMRMAAAYRAKPEGEQSIPNKTFSDYAYDLQDILEKNSVEIYQGKSGDAFDPVRQRAIKKVFTSDASLHGKVAESLSCGYRYNGRTISAEKIAVFYYEKPIEENTNSEVIENG